VVSTSVDDIEQVPPPHRPTVQVRVALPLVGHSPGSGMQGPIVPQLREHSRPAVVRPHVSSGPVEVVVPQLPPPHTRSVQTVGRVPLSSQKSVKPMHGPTPTHEPEPHGTPSVVRMQPEVSVSTRVPVMHALATQVNVVTVRVRIPLVAQVPPV
jgi:hypothetical protein